MRSSDECYSIQRQITEEGVMEMSAGGEGGMEERRTMARRANSDRRFAERRQPERAVPGRRVAGVPDRRSVPDRRGFAPELAG